LRPNFNNNWQKLAQYFYKKIPNFFSWLGEGAGLRPYDCSSSLIFLAGAGQKSWLDLATVGGGEEDVGIE
jgi:hypothetical protein